MSVIYSTLVNMSLEKYFTMDMKQFALLFVINVTTESEHDFYLHIDNHIRNVTLKVILKAVDAFLSHI